MLSDILSFSGVQPLAGSLIVSRVRAETHPRMESFIDKEGRYLSRSEYSVIICKFGDWYPFSPVVLYIRIVGS